MTSFPRGTVFALVTGMALAVHAGAVRADDHPRLSPTRDAIVTYRLTTKETGAHPSDVKVYFSGAGDQLRIDSSDGRGITILDRPTRLVTLIMVPQKVYTQLSPREGLRNPFLLDLSMHYTPAGEGKVAGYDCHKWAIDTTHGKATACVTEDGLILSESGVDADGMEGSLEAQTVTYQDVPASTFQPPEGFERIQPHRHVRIGGQENAGTAAGLTPSTIVPNALPGASSARSPQDVTQPTVSNDSTGDGSVSLPDQPPSNLSGPAPQR